jgi:hypothetical protein
MSLEQSMFVTQVYSVLELSNLKKMHKCNMNTLSKDMLFN